MELNPKLPDVYAYYGQALLRTGDPDAAAEAFRKALAANPVRLHLQPAIRRPAQRGRQIRRSARLPAPRLAGAAHDLGARYQLAPSRFAKDKLEDARRDLEAIVKESPDFTEAHVTLATVYYRLKRKADGDRERAIVQKLNAETQAKQQQGVNVK